MQPELVEIGALSGARASVDSAQAKPAPPKAAAPKAASQQAPKPQQQSGSGKPRTQIIVNPLFPWNHPSWVRTHKQWIAHHQNLWNAVQDQNAKHVNGLLRSLDRLAKIQSPLPYGYFPHGPYPSFPVSQNFPYHQPFYPTHPASRYAYAPFAAYLPPRWPARRPPIVPGLKPVFSRPIDFPLPPTPHAVFPHAGFVPYAYAEQPQVPDEALY